MCYLLLDLFGLSYSQNSLLKKVQMYLPYFFSVLFLLLSPCRWDGLESRRYRRKRNSEYWGGKIISLIVSRINLHRVYAVQTTNSTREGEKLHFALQSCYLQQLPSIRNTEDNYYRITVNFFNPLTHTRSYYFLLLNVS